MLVSQNNKTAAMLVPQMSFFCRKLLASWVNPLFPVPKGWFAVDYRIYSITRRGVYQIFSVPKRLQFKASVFFKISYLNSQLR